VHERHRNQGVGRDLLRSAAQVLAAVDVTETSVVTAGRNIAALSLYKGEGFKTTDVALWYHRWFRDQRR
jgi:ribosomal protein S18 acetylase RimI-like enzyme